jgi:hypothetical protein
MFMSIPSSEKKKYSSDFQLDETIEQTFQFFEDELKLQRLQKILHLFFFLGCDPRVYNKFSEDRIPMRVPAFDENLELSRWYDKWFTEIAGLVIFVQ